MCQACAHRQTPVPSGYRQAPVHAKYKRGLDMYAAWKRMAVLTRMLHVRFQGPITHVPLHACLVRVYVTACFYLVELCES